MDTSIETILSFWFGPLNEHGYAAEERNKLWFQSSPETDATIREHFGALINQARRSELDAWAESAHGRLALIILLDQFTRNIFRGSAEAFSGDTKARTLCLEGLTRGHDQALAPDERVFLYIPLEHSENLADQERCVELFTQLRDQAPPPHRKRAQSFLDYASLHKDIIARFGRFPHRNQVLGRASSDEEQEYLATANRFGQ
jgi:uncharacterized protein (DUF924 family)